MAYRGVSPLDVKPVEGLYDQGEVWEIARPLYKGRISFDEDTVIGWATESFSWVQRRDPSEFAGCHITGVREDPSRDVFEIFLKRGDGQADSFWVSEECLLDVILHAETGCQITGMTFDPHTREVFVDLMANAGTFNSNIGKIIMTETATVQIYNQEDEEDYDASGA
jgi:hypothetical protein